MENENRIKEMLRKSYNKIKELQDKVDILDKQEPIAVIGMACKFPGGIDSLQKYWDTLKNKVETLKVIPPDRWDINEYYDPDNIKPNGIRTKYANFIDDIDKFDSNFFGITPKEAEAIDPQHRLLLEVSWNAFENSGLNVKKLRGSRTGVFIGITGSEYLRYLLKIDNENKINNPYVTTGLMSNAACGRLSYFYDFNGPSVAVDTACSSSLVSVDMAIKNLRDNKCDLALAGGVSAIIVPDSFNALSKMNAISKDGRCKSFDAAADGFGRGEGCGLIILKRLKDAVEDNDNILAVILSSAVGHDGRSNGMTAPNGLAQEKVMQEALQESGLTIDDIDYIEAHGTGTPLGDPIEVEAINSIYKNKKNKLVIGTVKTNFGHLEAASGIAGIIKVILSMQNGAIPPNLHFNNPNPNIPWDQVNLKVANELIPWKVDKLKAACVNSIGISGTIGHVILQEYRQLANEAEIESRLPYGLLTISAKNRKAMLRMLKLYKDYFKNTDKNVLDICYTSNISRSCLEDKIAFVGKDKNDFVLKISKYLDKFSQGKDSKIDNKKVVFLFTGQGSQYKNICKELYDTQPYFKELLDICDKEFQKHIGESIIQIMYNCEDEEMIYKTNYAQPIIFSIEYSLARLWMSWGVQPTLLIGHSIGEYAAGCIAQVFSLKDAVYMVSKRGQILKDIDGKGKMLGILANKQTVMDMIEEYKNEVSIAAVNGLNNITISGSAKAIDIIASKAKQRRIFVEKLKISVPFHSIMLSDYVLQYKKMIHNIVFKKPKIPVLSIRNGCKADVSSIDFWSSHIVKPISFYDEIKATEKSGYQVFLEIGGNATLSALGSEDYNGEALFLPSLRNNVGCWFQLISSIKELYNNGIDIDWNEFHKAYHYRKIGDMPLYQFEKKRHWIEGSAKKKNSEICKDNKYLSDAVTNENIIYDNMKLKSYELILSELKEFLSSYTGIEMEDIDVDKELFQLGLDSLMITQLRRKIKDVYQVDIDLNTFFVDLRTLKKIAGWIYNNQKTTISNDNVKIKGKSSELVMDENYKQSKKMLIESNVPPYIKDILAEQLEVMKKQLDTLQLYSKHEQLGFNNTDANEEADLIKYDMKDASERNQSIERILYSMKWKKNLNYYKRLKNDFSDMRGKTFIFFADNDDIADHLINYCEKQNAVCIKIKSGEKYKELNYNSYQINNQCSEDYEKLFKSINIKGKGYIVYLNGINDINEFSDDLHDMKETLRVIYTGLLNLIKVAIKLKLQNKTKLWIFTQNVHVPSYDHTVPNSLIQSTLWGFGRVISMEQNAFFGGLIDLDNEVYKICPEYIIKFVLSEKEDEVAIRNHGDFYFPRLSKTSNKDYCVNASKKINKKASYLITGGSGGLGLLAAQLLAKKGAHSIILVSRNGSEKKLKETIEKISKYNTKVIIMHGDVSIKEDMERILREISDNYPPLKGIIHCAGVNDDGMIMSMDWEKFNKVFLAKVYGTMILHNLTSILDLDFFIMFSSISVLGGIGQGNYAAANSFLNALADYRRRDGIPALSINWGPWHNVGMQRKFPEDFLKEEGIYDIRIPAGLNVLNKLLFNNKIYPNVIDVDWKTYKNFLPDRRKKDIYLQPMNDNVIEAFDNQSESLYEIYPMTSVQKRIFTLSQVKDRELSYHITNIINIKGKLDIEKLKKVINTLIKRHEALRTGFYVKNKKFIQTIYKEAEVNIDVVDGDENQLDKLIKDSIYSFNLETPPLIHTRLIKLQNHKYTLVLDYHHIIVDGFSLDIIAEEFVKLYKDIPLSQIDKYYKNYMIWENRFMSSEKFNQQEQFWMKQFESDLPILNLPLDYPRGYIQSFEGAVMYFKIDKVKVDKLKEIAVNTNTSLYMIMLSAFNILIYYLTYQNDIIIGSPIAIRNNEFDNVVGMFTNTVLFRNKVDEDTSFIDFLKTLKENCLQVYANQEYPFENLVNNITSKRDLSHNPLFDVMFAFENKKSREFKFKDLYMKRQNYEHDKAMFDLLFAVQNEPEFMNISINYCTKLFKPSTIERWYGYYENILDIITKNQNILISNIRFLPKNDKMQLEYFNNPTHCIYSESNLIHQLFEEQVNKNPDNIAVMFQDKNISYLELNKASNQLAYEIRKVSQSKKKIAIIINRSIEMIIGVLGILKSGSAYVPIEPDIPEDRIRFSLDSLNVGTIVTDSQSAIKLFEIFNEVKSISNIIIMDDVTYIENNLGKYRNKNIITSKDFQKNEDSNLPVVTSSDDVAYIIFTSGTTGRPKGVVVTHKPVINLIEWVNKTYHVNKKDKILFITSLSFDLSVYDIFGLLAAGGQIRIATREEIKDPKSLLNTLIMGKITFWDSAPPALRLLVPFLPKNSIKDNYLRLVFLSGDWIPIQLPNKIKKVFPGSKIIGLGGATEAVIWSNYYEIKDIPEWWTSIPYGKPIQNAKYYILDKKLRLCPIGVTGDLYIGGECLADGYTDVEMTKKKFIQSPFNANERIYDTGDIARWLDDGNIELLGRKDSQIKIRGYRIELGEIEAVLKEHEGLLDIVVLSKRIRGKEKKIIAYYTMKMEYKQNNKKLMESDLKNYLRGKLPEYMIPSRFIEIDKIPVTSNGKIDRKSLPEPEESEFTSNYKPPENRIEKQLVGIWEEVLDRKNIGIEDDFFELGGNSMNLISLASKIYEDMGIELPIMNLFKNPTIKGIESNYADNILAEESQKNMVLLNKENKKKIFFFPDLIGVGVIYKKIASLFDDYAFYAFNYIEDDDRIDKYVNMILNIDDDGEYLLMAYSAGGSLAFEVAKKLEEKNKKVAAIIMIDTYKNKSKVDVNEKQKEGFLKQLEYNINKHFVVGKMKEKIINRALKYYIDYMKTDNAGQIYSDIYLITSQDRNTMFKLTNDNWNNSTIGTYIEYSGAGPHLEMLQAGYVETNMKLIYSILNNVEEKKCLKNKYL